MLDADFALLCRRGLLMATLKSKCEAHKHALKLRCRVAQTRVWREMRCCSDPSLKRNAELLKPAFEVRIYPWTRYSRFSWNTTFALKWGLRLRTYLWWFLDILHPWFKFTWHLVSHIAYQQLTCPVTEKSYPYQDYRIQSCIVFSKPWNRNTGTIKAFIQANPYNIQCNTWSE